MGSEEAKPLRLFFALWPDEATQAGFDRAAQALHRACGGKRTRRENIHLTLAFLGDVAVGRADVVRAVAGQISVPAFELDFNRLGWWRRNQIAWSAPSDAPKPLFELVSGLQGGLAAEGFKPDDRPYLPHITLLRRAHCKEVAFDADPIIWPVREFVLVSSTLSENGSAYEIIGRWGLDAAGD
jgi:2'-5' RNA ligase